MRLQIVNDAAAALLGWDAGQSHGRLLSELAGGNPILQQFLVDLQGRVAAGKLEWREQLDIQTEGGRRVLLWACTPLPQQGEQSGFVIVFDDITNLLTAQRSAAWGEVARRLAHEIKNPLTPIQLSAERLRRKLRTQLNSESAQLLDRATHTIVQQVDAMQQMVNAFSEYARAPEMQWTRFALNQLIVEVTELYRLQDQRSEIHLNLDAGQPMIEADRGRLRQLLANLISNALHAVSGREGGRIEITTRISAGAAESPSEIMVGVSDNGPGFSPQVLQRAFEPYVTDKARGTGLGLAIVKRIVEEHSGKVEAENGADGGANVRVWLPVQAERRTEIRRERA
jgi:PAS domain S-box-containing protein